MLFFEVSALDSTLLDDAVFSLVRDIRQRLDWGALGKVTSDENKKAYRFPLSLMSIAPVIRSSY
jgi:hypothetical protein